MYTVDNIWCAAKCANKQIGSKLEWYDEFDSFPMFDVFAQLNDLIMSTMAISEVNWILVASASGLAAVLSLLTSIAGLPEVSD